MHCANTVTFSDNCIILFNDLFKKRLVFPYYEYNGNIFMWPMTIQIIIDFEEIVSVANSAEYRC